MRAITGRVVQRGETHRFFLKKNDQVHIWRAPTTILPSLDRTPCLFAGDRCPASHGAPFVASIRFRPPPRSAWSRLRQAPRRPRWAPTGVEPGAMRNKQSHCLGSSMMPPCTRFRRVEKAKPARTSPAGRSMAICWPLRPAGGCHSLRLPQDWTTCTAKRPFARPRPHLRQPPVLCLG